MAFYENCAERVAGIGLGCLWLVGAGGGAEAGVATTVAVVGLAALVSDQVRKHGPESAKALKAIRRKIADDLETHGAAEGWERRADIHAADQALARALPSCFLERAALAASAVSTERFPVAATGLILDQLAKADVLFGPNGPPAAREFAELVIKTALRAAIENKEYFSNLQPHLLMEMLHAQGLALKEISAIPDASARATVKLLKDGGYVGKAEALGSNKAQIEGILAAFKRNGLPVDQWQQALLESAARLSALELNQAADNFGVPDNSEFFSAAEEAKNAGDFQKADRLLEQAHKNDREAMRAFSVRFSRTLEKRAEIARLLFDDQKANNFLSQAAESIKKYSKEDWKRYTYSAGFVFDKYAPYPLIEGRWPTDDDYKRAMAPSDSNLG